MHARAPISVVIPAYNHERYIGEAIDSVLAQTLAEFELLIVDDGSRDGTAVMAEQRAAADPRVRVLRQANGGSHAAINRGIAETTAPWVAILNSDDRWAPQRLQRMMEVARDGGQFIVSDVRLIDGQGAEIDDPDHWWLKTLRDFRQHALDLGPLQGLLYGNYTVSTSNFFFSRELAQAIGPLRARRYVPDWDWALRAALQEPEGLRYLAHEPLLDYRLHGRNAILADYLLGDCEVNRLHRELLQRLGVSPALVAAVFRNQRDLRRNWRARGVDAIERFARDREEDVRSLQSEVRQLGEAADELKAVIARQAEEIDECARRVSSAVTQAELQAQRADAAVGRVQLAEAALKQAEAAVRHCEDLLRQRDEAIAQRDARLHVTESALRHSESLLDASNALVREAESSFTWRLARSLRRRLGVDWL